MPRCRLILNAFLFVFALLISFSTKSASPAPGDARMFLARGVVEEIKPEKQMIIIHNEAISNYMDAMTMPFNVKNRSELAGLQRGDNVTFQLHVTENESWVDHLVKTGSAPPQKQKAVAAPKSNFSPEKNSLRDYKFTNELGQAVSLNDFHGQALAITFFYTRCPLPDYCPRLSKNFAEASQKLETMTNAPANWHFLSISFDPKFDTPAMLKAYGNSYDYDAAHWSFLTGPPEKIAELARASGVTYESENGSINHNFRTLIVNAAGHLQMVFPTTGDLSDQIVAEILKAAVTDQNLSTR